MRVCCRTFGSCLVISVSKMVRQLIVYDKQLRFGVVMCQDLYVEPENWLLNSTDLNLVGHFDLGSTTTACLPSLHLRRWALERSPSNLLGADWSRPYWSRYTRQFHSVTRSFSQWRTHKALLWLTVLVLHRRKEGLRDLGDGSSSVGSRDKAPKSSRSWRFFLL